MKNKTRTLFLALLSSGVLVFCGCFALHKDVTRVEREVEASRELITEKGIGWQKKYVSLSEELIGLKKQVTTNKEAINTLSARLESEGKRMDEFPGYLSRELAVIRVEHRKDIAEISQSLAQTQELTGALDEKLVAILDEVKKENARLIKEIERIRKSFISRVHIVRKGQTISVIANLYGISAEEIIKMNDIPDPDRISIGQKLIIPPQRGN